MKRFVALNIIFWFLVFCGIASVRTYTYQDLENCRQCILDDTYNYAYDYNKDGKLTMSDLVKIRNSVLDKNEIKNTDNHLYCPNCGNDEYYMYYYTQNSKSDDYSFYCSICGTKMIKMGK